MLDALISVLGFDPSDKEVQKNFRNIILACLIFLVILAPNWLFVPRQVTTFLLNLTSIILLQSKARR